jgi:hypothetical protein
VCSLKCFTRKLLQNKFTLLKINGISIIIFGTTSLSPLFEKEGPREDNINLKIKWSDFV